MSHMTDVQKDRYLSIAKKYHLHTTAAFPPMSSGILAIDFIAGQLVPGCYCFSGAEASGKSTTIQHIIGVAIRLYKEMLKWMDDCENAVDPEYAAWVMRIPLERAKMLFGETGEKQEWARRPELMYNDSNVVEHVFGAMGDFLREITPTIRYASEHDTWYWVFNKTDAEQKMMKELGLEPSQSMSNRTESWCRVPRDFNPIQAILAVDSTAGLFREAVDDDNTKGVGIGAAARSFSEHFPLVKGQLKRRGSILLLANQLREKPMTKGDPRYEPGGNALKHNTDCRIWFTSRTSGGDGPDLFTRDDTGDSVKRGGLFIEPSVEYGDAADRYAFKSLENIKNKLATPFLNGWMRVHVSDGAGNPRGIDPVYDTFWYLRVTGQCDGSPKKGLKLRVSGWNDKHTISLTWAEFKTLVLYEEYHDDRTREGAYALKTPDRRLREHLFRQIRKKEHKDLFARANASGAGEVEGERRGKASDYEED